VVILVNLVIADQASAEFDLRLIAGAKSLVITGMLADKNTSQLRDIF
jgi:hypothetical protein